MKFNVLAILYILPSVLALAGSDAPTSRAIQNLTSDSFDSFIYSNKLVLIDFYTTWCRHCQNLSPELELANQLLQEMNLENPVAVGKVDCSTVDGSSRGITQFCLDMEVASLPCLKVFKDGEHHGDYCGPRRAKDIAEYMVRESKAEQQDK